jgi:hypothetical protein
MSAGAADSFFDIVECALPDSGAVVALNAEASPEFAQSGQQVRRLRLDADVFQGLSL